MINWGASGCAPIILSMQESFLVDRNDKVCKSLTIMQCTRNLCRKRITTRCPGNARGEEEPAVGFESTGTKMAESICEGTTETSFNSSEL